MEVLHAVGRILTKISANSVINLHVLLLFMCLFLWVIICAVIIFCIFMGNSCICFMYMFIVTFV
jgi:hypothetical protein